MRLGAGLITLLGLTMFCLGLAWHRTPLHIPDGFDQRLDIPASLRATLEAQGVTLDKRPGWVASQFWIYTALFTFRAGLVWSLVGDLIRRRRILAGVAAVLLAVSFIPLKPAPDIWFTFSNRVVEAGTSRWDPERVAEADGAARPNLKIATLDPGRLRPQEQRAAHYVLAQSAYIAKKPRELARHLAGMGADYVPGSLSARDRIIAMSGYARAQGQAVAPFRDRTLTPPGPLPAIMSRLTIWLGGCLVVVAMLVELLAARLAARLRRVHGLMRSLASDAGLAENDSVAARPLPLAQHTATLEARGVRLERLAPYGFGVGLFLILFAWLCGLPPVFPAKAFSTIHVPLPGTDFILAQGAVLQSSGNRAFVFGVSTEVVQITLNFLKFGAVLAGLYCFFARKWKGLAALVAVVVLMATADSAINDRSGATVSEPVIAALEARLASPFAEKLKAIEIASLRYEAAQRAYLRDDPVRAAQLLNAMSASDLEPTWAVTWRMKAMADWCRRHGQSFSSHSIAAKAPNMEGERIRAIAIGAAGLIFVILSGLSMMLAGVIAGRLGRLSGSVALMPLAPAKMP
ncbi:hypothetical protein [Caulobacter sp. LARHSG274]